MKNQVVGLVLWTTLRRSQVFLLFWAQETIKVCYAMELSLFYILGISMLLDKSFENNFILLGGQEKCKNTIICQRSFHESNLGERITLFSILWYGGRNVMVDCLILKSGHTCTSQNPTCMIASLIPLRVTTIRVGHTTVRMARWLMPLRS